MSTLQSPVPVLPDTTVAKPRPMPPLAAGDRLSHIEYLKRYNATPEKVKAERIEGVVYMAAAALSAGFHGHSHAHFLTWMGVYQSMTPGVAAADNSTVFLDTDNDPQPDAFLYVLPSHGGRVRVTKEGYIDGAPELIVEIAASSVSYDLGPKLNAYRRNGVREYIVHRTYDDEIDYFQLRDGNYDRLSPATDGILRSEAFPGLWLARRPMLEGNLTEVLATLQQGLASPEHDHFRASLAAASQNSK